jgi:hypothetical protein
MKQFSRVAYVCLIPLTLAAAGCESISLISRGDPLARDEQRRDRDLDRNREARRDGDRDRFRDEIVGTVQRVDPDRQELQLRTTDGESTRVRYDLSTRVSHRGRDLRVEELRYGDLVNVELSRNRGERYAAAIRMNDRADVGSSRW